MSWRFNPPPGWPVPSGDWLPPAAWVPDPAWPPPPPGWEFWVYAPARPPSPPPPRTCRPPRKRLAATPQRLDPPGPVARAIAAVIIAVLSLLSLAVGAGLHFDLH